MALELGAAQGLLEDIQDRQVLKEAMGKKKGEKEWHLKTFDEILKSEVLSNADFGRALAQIAVRFERQSPSKDDVGRVKKKITDWTFNAGSMGWSTDKVPVTVRKDLLRSLSKHLGFPVSKGESKQVAFNRFVGMDNPIARKESVKQDAVDILSSEAAREEPAEVKSKVLDPLMKRMASDAAKAGGMARLDRSEKEMMRRIISRKAARSGRIMRVGKSEDKAMRRIISRSSKDAMDDVEDIIEDNPEFLKSRPNFQREVDAVNALRTISRVGIDPARTLSRAPRIDVPVHGNFCGPGTDVMRKLLTGKTPTDALDSACLAHDVSYIRAGATAQPAFRKRVVESADRDLIEAASALQGPAALAVVAAMKAKAAILPTDSFLTLDSPPMTMDQFKSVDLKIQEYLQNFKTQFESEGVDTPEFEAALDTFSGAVSQIDDRPPDLKVSADTEDLPPLAPPVPGGQAAEEQKGDETPATGGGGTGGGVGGGVSDLGPTPPDSPRATITAPVIAPGVAGVAAPVPMPRLTGEVAAQPPIPQTPIVGERSMRPMTFKMEGDTVEPTAAQVKQNNLWLDNFTWIDPGHGLGNQQRVPWEMGGGRANNSAFEAQEKNKMLKYSGNLFVGDQHIREVKEISSETQARYRQPMTSTTQNRQRMIRNGALPAGKGRQIQMYRRTQTTPMMWRSAPQTRLLNGDVVDGKRV